MEVTRKPTNCPRCGKPMSERILHSRGIVVCEEQYLQAMREIQAEEDAGRSAHVNGGFTDYVIPMTPLDEEKYARCHYCYGCHVVTGPEMV